MVAEHAYAQTAPVDRDSAFKPYVDVYFCYKLSASGMPQYMEGSVDCPVVLDEGELPEDLRHLQIMLVDDEDD